MEGGCRGHVVAVAAAALALSGCTFFLLSYLKDRPLSTAPNSCIRASSLIPCANNNNGSPSPSVGKRVRFAQVNENKKKFQAGKARKASPSAVGRDHDVEDCRRKRRVTLPENWRRLYCGMNRYRSQRATLLLYT